MNKEDIIRMARELMEERGGARMDEEHDLITYSIQLATLVASAEREACIDLLMGLHEAQSNNGAHNYYHFASNAIKELRGKPSPSNLNNLSALAVKANGITLKMPNIIHVRISNEQRTIT